MAYLLIGLFVVCFLQKSAYPKDLAKIDDVVITDSDLTKRIGLLPERNRGRIDKEKMLNKMIDEELITREAQRLNLHDKEDYKLKVEAFKRELLVDLYLQQYLQDRNTEENQKKFYEQNKEKYTSPEMVRISVIRVNTEEEAKEILKKVREGEDFAELARKYSKGPGASKGGDFGFRAREALRKELADAAFSIKKGEISDPVKTKEGYHIIKVTDHRERGIATFEDVKIRLSSEYAKKLLEERFSELRKAAKIQVDSAALRELKIERGKGGEK
jgi:peptidyl-prolyl cis-trans isomerase C